MGSVDIFYTYLKDIREQAGELANAIVLLYESFESVSELLIREDQVRRLTSLRDTIARELEEETKAEVDSSHIKTKLDIALSFTGFTAKLLTAKNQRARAFVNPFFADTGKTTPYGLVMVCIGEKGIPDSVSVISISRLARDSYISESSVIKRIQGAGNLLFSPEDFFRLIDKVATDIRDRRLSLPVSREKLSEMITSGYLISDVVKIQWIPKGIKQT